MTRKTALRLCVVLLVPALALLTAVVPQLGRPGGVAAQTTTTNVSFCGTLSSAYVAPGTATTGSLVFSAPAVSLTIAPGAVVTVATGLATTAGSSVCVVGFTNSTGQLIGATLSAPPATTSTVVLCGVIGSTIVQPTAMAPGSISIGGNTFPIAVGAAAFTGASVTPGANVCLTATLNGLGQITGGTVAANTITGTTTPLNVCGTLSSYTPAGTSTTGTVAFSAPTASSYVIVANTTIGNYSSSLLNTTVCLVGQLLNGQIVSASFVPQVVTTVTVCGQVTAYSAATTGATATAGLITIGGTTLGIAPNTTFSGASITQNSFYCIAATLNALQQITAGTVTQVTTTATPTATGTPATATATATATTVPSTLVICGLVTVYTAATSSAAGTITIAGTTVAIAPGAVITGTTLGANANVCISATLNSSQQITNAAVAVNTATATATATIPANIPSPPPPPGGPATATPTATATPVPPTATATAAPPTNTPVPPAPTNTPKPKKPTATATAPAPSAPSPAAPSPSAPKPVPAPKTLPSTGFGGLNSSVAHNAAMGRVYRATNGKAALAAEPQTGGGNPISPAVPVVLGLLAIGLGVLSRRFVFGKR